MNSIGRNDIYHLVFSSFDHWYPVLSYLKVRQNKHSPLPLLILNNKVINWWICYRRTIKIYDNSKKKKKKWKKEIEEITKQKQK